LGGLFKRGKGKKKTSADTDDKRNDAIAATMASAAIIAATQVADESKDSKEATQAGPSREEESKDIQFAATEAELSENPNDDSDEEVGVQELKSMESDTKIAAESLLVGRARSEEQPDDDGAAVVEAQDESGYDYLVDVDYGDIDQSLRDVSESEQAEDLTAFNEVSEVGDEQHLVEGDGDASQVVLVSPGVNVSNESEDIEEDGDDAQIARLVQEENMDAGMPDVPSLYRDDLPVIERDGDVEAGEDASRDQSSKVSKKKSILGGFMRIRSRSKDRDQSPNDQMHVSLDDKPQSADDAEYSPLGPLASVSAAALVSELRSDETAETIVHEEKDHDAIDDNGNDSASVSEVESHAIGDAAVSEKEAIVWEDKAESDEASPPQPIPSTPEVGIASDDSHPSEADHRVKGDDLAGPSSRSGSFFGGLVRRRGRSNERDDIPPDGEAQSGPLRDVSLEDEVTSKQQRKSRLFGLRGRSKDRDTLPSGSAGETEGKDENEPRRARERKSRLFGFSSRSKRRGSETGIQEKDKPAGISSVEDTADKQVAGVSMITPLAAPTGLSNQGSVADEFSEHQVLDSNDGIAEESNLMPASASSTEIQIEQEAATAVMTEELNLRTPSHGLQYATEKEGDVDERHLAFVTSESGAAAVATSVLASGVYEELQIEQNISRETDDTGEVEVAFEDSGETESYVAEDDVSHSKDDSGSPHEETLSASNSYGEEAVKERDFAVSDDGEYDNYKSSAQQEACDVDETNASTESVIVAEAEAKEQSTENATQVDFAVEALSLEQTVTEEDAEARASESDVVEVAETTSASQLETVQPSQEAGEEYEEFRVGGLVLKRKKKKSRSGPPAPRADDVAKTELQERLRQRRETSESGTIAQHVEKDKDALKSSKLDSEVESIMARRRELATSGVVSEVPKTKDEADLKASVVDPEVLAAMSRRRQSVDNSIASASFHGSVAESQEELSHAQEDEALKPSVLVHAEEEERVEADPPNVTGVLPPTDENDKEGSQRVTSELHAPDEAEEEEDRKRGTAAGVAAVAGVAVVGGLAAATEIKGSREPVDGENEEISADAVADDSAVIVTPQPEATSPDVDEPVPVSPLEESREPVADEHEEISVDAVAHDSAVLVSPQPEATSPDVDETVSVSPLAAPDKTGENLTERRWWPFANRDTYQELQSDPQSDIELGLGASDVPMMDEEVKEELSALPAAEKDSLLVVDDKENQKFVSPAHFAQDAAEQEFDVEKGATRDEEFAVGPAHEDDMAGTKITWASADSDVAQNAVDSYVEPSAANESTPQGTKKELQSKDSLKSAFPCYRIGLLCSLLGLIVLGFAVGFGVNASRSNKDRSLPTLSPITAVPLAPSNVPGSVPTSSPTPGNPLRQPTYDLLCGTGLPDCSVLNDSETPQGMAFNWLLDDNAELILMPDDQKIRRYALATIYFALDGSNWTMNDGWLSEADECEWYTTAIASCLNRAFVSLELDNNKVQGILPYETNLLTTLTALSLTNPADGVVISGGFPIVTNLSSLFRIDLSGNSITGTLPESLFTVATGLLDLRLQDNEMSGPIPVNISSLASLTTLNLAGNRFSSLPSGIFSLSNLRALNLARNGFGGPLYDLSRLTKLQDLNLAGNGLVGTIPASIGALTQLSNALDLSNNTLSGRIPTGIGNLRSLVTLLLNANRLTGPIPASLGNLTSVKVVRLDQNDLTGTIPSQVCATFNVTQPLSYVDCDQVTNSCFSFCCQESTGSCECVAADPFVCIER
jgi:Leucine-rich repeat (LRR) protein